MCCSLWRIHGDERGWPCGTRVGERLGAENSCMNEDLKLEAVLSEIAAHERRNREPEMQVLMRQVAATHGDKVLPGRILIVENYPGATCALAVFRGEGGSAVCAPMDPLAISFYEYRPTGEQDAMRRSKNPGMRDGFCVRGPLTLVETVVDPSREISKAQLIAIHTLVGNHSTWWPVSDYSDLVLEEVFGDLELNVVWLNGCPVGIAHLDYSMRSDEAVAKVVFLGLDPAVQGQGLGRELVHGVMSDAMDRGVQAICLDTVAHRDSRAQTGKAVSGGRLPSAHEVYVKSGFKMVGIKVIDPANPKQLEEEGLALNQLNGPLEYGVSDVRPLREAVYEAFGVPQERRLCV
jgi:GNAT superfamily N-acetyltransferase